MESEPVPQPKPEPEPESEPKSEPESEPEPESMELAKLESVESPLWRMENA